MWSMKAGTWPSHAKADPARAPKPGNTSGKSTSWRGCPRDTKSQSTDPLISSTTLSTDGLNAPAPQESVEEWSRRKGEDRERETFSNNEQTPPVDSWKHFLYWATIYLTFSFLWIFRNNKKREKKKERSIFVPLTFSTDLCKSIEKWSNRTYKCWHFSSAWTSSVCPLLFCFGFVWFRWF